MQTRLPDMENSRLHYTLTAESVAVEQYEGTSAPSTQISLPRTWFGSATEAEDLADQIH